MEPQDPLEAVRAALREGKGRAAVLRELRKRGVDAEEAERLWRKARTGAAREALPDEFRRAGRKHLVIGLCASVFSLGLTALTLLLVRAMYFSTAEKPLNGDLAVLSSAVTSFGVLGLSVGEILYARRRFREARELEAGEK